MAKKLLWLALPVGAATGAAFYFLKKQAASGAQKADEPRHAKATGEQSPAKAGGKKTSGKGKGPWEPKSPKTGYYSFISGFKDAATVELQLPYDSECCSFAVVEDEFLTESGDSHVAVLYGEQFSAQFEYAVYYHGEDFAALTKELASHHQDLSPAVYGVHQGVCYQAGDVLCFAFPIPEDSHSYLLASVLKAPDNDDALSDLRAYPDLSWMLSSMSFSRT